VAMAPKLARKHPELTSIVTVVNDTGQRYLTTALCGEDKHVEIPERDHPLDAHTRRPARPPPVRPGTDRVSQRRHPCATLGYLSPAGAVVSGSGLLGGDARADRAVVR